VVLPQGNRRAQEMLAKVFTKSNATWRGLGDIPDSGMTIARKYERFDAEKKFGVTIPTVPENKACRCGEILKGLAEPEDCAIFGTACTPENPIGACMVSSEGTCAAAFRYGSANVTP
jgi:hydrogenase expression/formation protein HypD